jgi:hypothetical protein
MNKIRLDFTQQEIFYPPIKNEQVFFLSRIARPVD